MNKTHPLLRYFQYKHLPGPLMRVSKNFHEIAISLDNNIPDGTEKDAGMRKLLEAKDCFVRAALVRKKEDENLCEN